MSQAPISALALATALLTTVAGDAAVVVRSSAAPESSAQAFTLADVTLAEGSAYAIARDRNRAYLVGLNSSRLLCIFTSAANLTRCVGHSCPTAGGASAPVCNPLPGEMGLGSYYGHYLGHYLSATAFLINGTRDADVKAKAEGVLLALNRTMGAWADKYGLEHDGFLFPYDPIVFHYLHYGGCARHLCGLYSVPYYTLHKMMAGLLDHATHAASDLAWHMILRMAAWVGRHASAAVAQKGMSNWQRVLSTEWGGMNEVLFNLYALTRDPMHLATGRLFNHYAWSAPLAAGVDDLGGNHANTHIPEVIGNAVGYEQTGNATDRAIAEEFFLAVTTNHSWVTGGSNDGEYWGAARRMGDQLNGNTEESCTQYNVLKVARHLFLWSANASYADFYERAILNGIIGNQDRADDVSMTSFIYMLPLGASGMRKPWGRSDERFPCCWGTLSEQLAKMADSIYFRANPANGSAGGTPTLYINQYVASSVAFAAAGMSIVQTTSFPIDPDHTTTLTIAPLGATSGSLVDLSASAVAPPPSTFAIKLRVPGWAISGRNVVLLNGQPHSGAPVIPGQYLTVRRAWKVGDTLSAHFPMGFSAEALNDDRPAFNATLAYMYGPMVLAGLTNSRWFIPAGPPDEPATFITRTSSEALTFEAKGQLLEPKPPVRARAETGAYTQLADAIQMTPLMDVVRQRYTIYFDTLLHTIPYAAGGAIVPSDSPAAFEFSRGASASGGPKDAACSGGNVRSGNPGATSRVSLDHPMLAPGYEISAVSLAFRYTAGYTPPPGRHVDDPIVTVLLTNTSGTTLATIYTSQPLGNYSFDHFTSYSPPIKVAATGLHVRNDKLVFVTLEIANRQRNLQIPIDDLRSGWDVEVAWSKVAEAEGHTHHMHHHHDDGDGGGDEAEEHAGPFWR